VHARRNHKLSAAGDKRSAYELANQRRETIDRLSIRALMLRHCKEMS